MSKKKSEKEIQEEIANNLKSLLGDDPILKPQAPAPPQPKGSTPVQIDGDGIDNGMLTHPNAQPMNLHEAKDEAQRDAKKTLKSLIDFYLGAKMIKKNDYAKFKQRIDEMSLSNMMFAIKTAQLAVIKLLEEIDMGNTHPRNFEALVSLNGQMMNMIKHQQALFVTMEEGYKKIKQDQIQLESEDRTEDVPSEDVTILDGSFKSRGTKMLMQNLRKTIETGVENGQAPIEHAPRLTDAHNRPENKVRTNQTEKKADPNDEIYGDLDEHF